MTDWSSFFFLSKEFTLCQGIPSSLLQNKQGPGEKICVLFSSLLVSPGALDSCKANHLLMKLHPTLVWSEPEACLTGLHHPSKWGNRKQNGELRAAETTEKGSFLQSVISHRTQQDFSNGDTKSPVTNLTVWWWHAPGLMPTSMASEQCKDSRGRRGGSGRLICCLP